VAVNLGLALLLMPVLAHVGIAMALSASGWLNALTLFTLLVRRGHFRLDGRARGKIPRIVLAAFGRGGVLIGLRAALGAALAGRLLLRISSLGALVVVGALAFILLALVLGVVDWHELRLRLRRQAA
jgi:putative peptidoglycan lipid II flippase